MESSSFSSIVLWFGRNNIFSRLSNECQAHEAQLYRGWFWEDFSVPANIFSLGRNGIQSICGNFTECTKLLMKISLWASDIWPPTQTITKFCTISCSSTSLLSLVELDLLLISSSIWGMSPLPVPEWWEPGLWGVGRSLLTEQNSGVLEVLLSHICQGLSPWAPLAASCSAHVSQERSCAAGWVLRGVFTVLPQCWLCCCLSQGLNAPNWKAAKGYFQCCAGFGKAQG